MRPCGQSRLESALFASLVARCATLDAHPAQSYGEVRAYSIRVPAKVPDTSELTDKNTRAAHLPQRAGRPPNVAPACVFPQVSLRMSNLVP